MGVRKIPLSNSTKFILVDEDDYEELNKYTWRLNKSGYAYREIKIHREVIGLEDSDERLSHHKNENKLDNRKENLDVVTKVEHTIIHNKSRSGKRNKGKKTWHGFQYTTPRKQGDWISQFTFKTKQHYLGVYKDPVTAMYISNTVRDEM
jgi:hypothetical protein